LSTPLAVYVPAGELAGARNPFGRTLANRGLFHALAAYGDPPAAFVVQDRVERADLVAAIGLEGDQAAQVAVAQRGSPAAGRMTAAGALFIGDPYYDALAWERRRAAGDAGYSLIGLVHTLAPPEMRRKIAQAVASPVQPWDAIVCTSPSVKSALGQMFDTWDAHVLDRFGGRPIPRPQTPVIPLGVDAPRLAAQAARPAARAAMRAELGLADDEALVLWVGRLSFFEKAYPQPMFRALEEAAQATGRRIAFAMAGWFPNGEIDRARYVEAAQAYAPSVRVSFEDGNDASRVADLWAAADIFLSLVDNIQETFGLTPVEAMASGLPVVVSDWDGYRFTVRDGVDGFLVPTLGGPADGLGASLGWAHALHIEAYQSYVGGVAQHTAVDVGAAARALAELVSSPELRRRMGAAGQARVAEAFDWPVVAAQIRTLADDLAERRRDAAPGTSANPFVVDPFVDFAAFPTASLTPQTRLAIRPGASMQDLVRAGNVRLDQAAAYHRAPFAQTVHALGAIERGEVATVAEVLARFPAELHGPLQLSLLWLCKLGILEWSA